MKLTNPEKLILLMLSEIYEKVGLEDVNTKLLRSAIYSENTWALDWEMPGVVGSEREPTPASVSTVLNYLEMWSFIEDAFAGFSDEDKDRIARAAAPFGTFVRFRGFDGNNEAELLSVLHFLVEDMGRFSRYRGMDLNSHVPMEAAYRRMYKIFETFREGLTGLAGLSADQVSQLLLARIS